jgi:acetyl/propionyl-CoA carboxylase alpha subunit
MLAKLVVWAPDREEAIKRLRRALQEYRVLGIATTLSLFRALVDMEDFRQAEFHTAFLDELLASHRLEELHSQQDPEAEEAAVVAAACLATLEAGSLPEDPFAVGAPSAWWGEGMRILHGRFPR